MAEYDVLSRFRLSSFPIQLSFPKGSRVERPLSSLPPSNIDRHSNERLLRTLWIYFAGIRRPQSQLDPVNELLAPSCDHSGQGPPVDLKKKIGQEYVGQNVNPRDQMNMNKAFIN